MEYRIVLTHIEIEINLHTSVVGVAGHSVPVRANLKLGKSHSELAGLNNLGVYVLIDNSLVAILKAAAGNLTGLGDVDLNDRILGMSGTGGSIELSGVCRIVASKGDLLIASADINTVAGVP